MIAVTDAAGEALEILRDGSTFQWSSVALVGLVFYVYAVEVERRRFDIVFAGLAFWLMDWFNELVNSATFHATDRLIRDAGAEGAKVEVWGTTSYSTSRCGWPVWASRGVVDGGRRPTAGKETCQRWRTTAAESGRLNSEPAAARPPFPPRGSRQSSIER